MNAFTTRQARWIVAVSALSLVCAVVLAVVADDPARRTIDHRPAAGSVSAIGHRAFVAVLQRLGVPVVVSTFKSADRAGDHAVLVVAEPRDVGPGSRARSLLRARLEGGRTLVVLPKRTATPHPSVPNWAGPASLLARDEVEEVLRVLDESARVVRPPALTLAASPYRYAPALADPQLVTGDQLDPIIGGPEGALLASLEGDDAEILVLADPDLIATHGLGDGDNAALVIAILDDLRAGDAVVIDETAHGNERVASLWSELANFPLVLLPLSVLLVVAGAVWTYGPRFGAPLPTPSADVGTAFLIAQAADLVREGGQAGASLERYLAATVKDVLSRAHAPPGLDAEGQRRWLDDLAGIRGLGRSLADVEAAVRDAATPPARAAEVVAAAELVHAWRRDIFREGT